ncbi:lipid kinase [Roseomonas sp. SSH11]|uniref:Lipid kinase n=2 Tax=Pararoseomonas baculiformis TaxID=2820812 RepID=A0ABS4AIT5_9PROT|nr:lipid kinase [Pararoseomonas baculiformis]
MAGAEPIPPGHDDRGSPPRRALVVINSKSRRGMEDVASALASLEQGGFTLVREDCKDPEGLRDTIRRLAPSIGLVVLGGGDGTMNAAAPALIETGLPLGILPLGTANDLARTLGLPQDAEEAARVILEGVAHRVDLGEVNGHPFFNVASIGLSVEVTRALTRDVKRRWGRLGYAIATGRALWRMRPFSAEIRCDGQSRRVRTLQIAVGNGLYYGGGIAIKEDARIDDGRLNLYSLEFESLWKLALVYPAFRSGRHGMWREVRTVELEEAEIRTRRPRRVNTDGEITTSTPARFRILRRAVTIMVPAPAERDTAAGISAHLPAAGMGPAQG